MSRYLNIVFFQLVVVLLFAGACTLKKKELKTPATFDLNNPQKFVMPSSLLEVSGISFHNGKKDTIYLIQDEAGKLFRLALGARKENHLKFGKSGDYEDVTMLKDKVIVLKSDGTLFSFPKHDAVVKEIVDVKEWKDLVPEGEYEGLYGDEGSGRLYVLCKRCEGDAHSEKVSGFILEFGETLQPVSNFGISIAEIRRFSKKVKSGFRPSGLAKDPLTGDWFIISAANKLLVITDTNWKVKAVYPFNGNTFYQPEGIAFDAEGNLYISNEGDELSDGNVLKFIRRTQ
jgi:hypothetical protein